MLIYSHGPGKRSEVTKAFSNYSVKSKYEIIIQQSENMPVGLYVEELGFTRSLNLIKLKFGELRHCSDQGLAC